MNWTPRLVEERLVEAAEVLKRLPHARVQGHASTGPKAFLGHCSSASERTAGSRPRPSPAAISRMEETLTWTAGLDPIDSRIAWMKAAGERWKAICRAVGLQRSAAHRHWLFALSLIALRVNGRRVNRKLSQDSVIALAAVAESSAADSKVCGGHLSQ